MNHFGKFLVASFVALSCGVVRADSITASLYSPQSAPGSTPIVVNLQGVTPTSQSTIVGNGYTITFSGVASNQGVVQGASGGNYAIPVAGVSGGNAQYLTGNYGSSLTTNAAASGNYLSTGLGTITLTFAAPETSFVILWGSIDTGNSLTFNDVGNYTVTGAMVQTAAAGFAGNGFQGPGGSAYVLVNTSTPFTTVTETSSTVSFENAGIAASNTPFTTGPGVTPEPASITLMGTGVMMAAAGMFFRSRKLRMVSAF